MSNMLDTIFLEQLPSLAQPLNPGGDLRLDHKAG